MKLLFVASSFLICTAYGVETNQVTAGTGATIAVGTGVISFKKFTSATNLRDANTEAVHPKILNVSSMGEPKVFANDELERLGKRFKPSDEVSIVHYLNDVKNKELHLERKRSEISSYQSTANSYRVSAASALIPTTTTETDAQGKVSMVTGSPNYAAYASYNSMADSAEASARQASVELGNLKSIAADQLPKIQLLEVVDSSPKSVEKALAKIKAFGVDGGKILQVSRIPENIVKQAARQRLIGGAMAAASVASILAAGEELLEGRIAEKVEGSSSRFEKSNGMGR